MRRHLVWIAVLGAATGAAALAVPSGGALADRTPPYGAFGFTTQGLGHGYSYGEPSLAIAPDGQHYAVSTPGGGAQGGTVQIWQSSDQGSTFQHTQFDSDSGGGDSELDFLPPDENGNSRLLAADLELTDLDNEIHWSDDYGTTWSGPGPRAGLASDRQWFAHTPDGKRVFLAYHDLAAEAEVFVESGTRGESWGPPQPVHDPSQVTLPGTAVAPASGGAVSLADDGVNTYSGPMIVAPNGEDFYVVYSISNAHSNVSPDGGGMPPFGGVKGIVVAHSSDAGKSWSNEYAVVAQPKPDNIGGEEIVGTMFPWAFVDQAGTLYVVYGSTRDSAGSDNFGYYYVYKTAQAGATWSTPRRIDGLRPGVGSVVFNTGGAVAPGVIDVAWLQKDTSGIGEDEGTWSPWFAQITGADTSSPTIMRQRITTLPNHKNGICIQGTICLLPKAAFPGSHDRSLLDFIELAVNPVTGMASLVYADNGGFRPGQTGGEVVFAQQTRQPPLPQPHRPESPPGGGPKPSAMPAGALAGQSLLLLLAVPAVRRRRTA